MRRISGIALLLASAATLAGCGQIRAHRGYVSDPLLVQSVRPGIDNRTSVEGSLGRPTFTGQFGTNDWYYVSRQTRQLAFARPRPLEQMVLHISFDQNGQVTKVERSGIELVKKINPDGDKTPTLGRESNLFEDLFGNIGRVGAPGTGQGGGAGGP